MQKGNAERECRKGMYEMAPNIVFFFSDQQRWDTLGCNGQIPDVTPRLDAFAREDATNFVNCITPQPVCGPARAMLQTGLYPTQVGCFRNAVALPPGQRTIATAMKEAGYEVGYVGKWHLASNKDTDHYETCAVPQERRGGYDGFWRAADVLEFTSHGYGGYVFDENGTKLEFDGYRTDCITDYALEFIRRYDGTKPFFLFLSHIEPHHQNDREDFEGPKGSRERYKNFVAPPDLEPGKGDWERFYPDYLGCVNALDTNFGRVVDALKEKGIYEDTMLLYASDHGCHFRTLTDEARGGGGDDYKRNSFENTIHVPLLVKGPGFAPGRREEKVVSLIDLPRTLMSAAGCRIWDGVQGRPLQEVLSDDWENYAYIQISESYVGRALRGSRYKYVVYAPDLNPWVTAGSEVYRERYLFDLKEDPLETHNLLGDERYDEVRADMRSRLIAFAERAGEGRIRIEEDSRHAN